MLDREGKKAATIAAPVPRHLPHTAPAAEFYAAQLAHKMLQPPATIHTDCLSVYKAARALPCVNTKSPYVGMLLEMSRRNKSQPIHWGKVKAHIVPAAPGSSEAERILRIGNDMADRAAKYALK
mgnify:CR=1 FL=1